ncbi:MAG: hypothetical protein BWY08_00676 [Bacteroidetes bacterium ADurb.Bin174]|jgi:hypothetical protein|nr:MAG: hypothetical protein BWY08_00676 [Bacteroidetes bacterium ADurb.Bin174]
MRRTILYILVPIIGLIYSDIVSTQTAEGGGVYIRNNGKLINSIVTENYAVTGFGVAGAAGEVVNCRVMDNYYLKSSVVYPGDMFFDDGVVFTPTYDANGSLIFPENYDASNVIGICFWSNTHNDYINGRSWIVSVDEVSIPWSPNRTNGWNPVDIPGLYNYGTAETALMDYDGEGNTALIVNEPQHTVTVNNCAAKYCYEHRRAAGEDAKWFLPSIGQLRALDDELELINELLLRLGKTEIKNNYYWSSNEYNQMMAWAFYFPLSSAYLPSNDNKTTSNHKVRPVAIVSQR